MSNDTVPDFQSFFLPYLQAISDGKIYAVRDIYETLADTFQLSDQAREEQIPSGRQKLYHNRIAWSKTYLKNAGLLEQPERGQVTITSKGEQLLEHPPEKLDVRFLKDYSEEFAAFHSTDSNSSTDEGDNDVNMPLPQSVGKGVDTPDIEIKNVYLSLQKALAKEVLEKVKAKSFQFFEQLVVDLLIAMGYGGADAANGTRTRSGQDGGIDGLINEDTLGLDKIYIQAKRWEGNVGRPEIQKFVGALAQEGAKKGVFITTSDFTQDAWNYIPRNDYSLVRINGERLAELMITHNIGVSIKDTYLVKRVDTDYFEGEVV
ncbi:restriction endonuclease [Neolewinella agarilytica]|uniref:Restriction system protein n=1 Tax=Neolewinella agarilytica TaxID=478744 RepID=A0A1H9NM96_9BACT|nr:restriction endonuclease [Neolewinella agarilytica]SER37011.1 restriction system protein [Neolewinella agarilytica]